MWVGNEALRAWLSVPIATPFMTHVASRTSLRQAVLEVCLLLLATLGLYHQLVQHPTDLMVGVHSAGTNDLTGPFLRLREIPRTLHQQFDKWSMWDPYLALGMPVHGNPQMALCYPPNWISMAFGAEDTISWLLVFHLWWGGVGCWLLARRWGLSGLSALFAGLVACGAPYVVAHTAEGHVAQIYTVAWMPWTLWAFDRFLTTDGRAWRAVSICLALSFFAGHVQELYYIGLLTSGTVLVIAFRAWRQQQTARATSLLLRWGLAGGITVGLIACDLLPIWLNAKECVRGEGLPMSVAGDGLKLAHLQQLLDPFALGGPEDIDRVRYGFYWCKLCYFGIAPLLLAIFGLLTQWQRPETKRLTWQAAFAFVFSFGSVTPLFGLCYRCIPMINSFRMPSRMLFFCSFAVALLAGLGLDRILRPAPARREDEPAPEATSAVARSMDASSVLSRTNEAGTEANSDAVSTPRLRPIGVLVGVIALAIAGGEIKRHADRVLAYVPRETLRTDSELSRFFKRHVGDARVLAPLDLYSDPEALRDSVRRVRGYEPVGQFRFALMLDALLNVPDEQLDFAGFGETRLDSVRHSIADLLGVKYYVSSKRQAAPPGWKLVQTGQVEAVVTPRGVTTAAKNFGIYENQTPLPRAFVVGKAVELTGVDPKKRVDTLEQLDPRAAVLLERDVLTGTDRAPFTPATITQDQGDRIVIETSTELPGYLVLAELMHPGWRVLVDQQPAEILTANLGLRGVALTAGRHTVEFQFEVPGQRLGLQISSAALLLLLISCLPVSKQPKTVATAEPYGAPK